MKNEKRITLKEWEYIGKYNPAKSWIRPFCTYTLIKTDEHRFRREVKVNLFIYLLLVIPLHFLKALYCLWDGGLKEFEIENRDLGFDRIEENGENYSIYPEAKEIWEKA